MLKLDWAGLLSLAPKGRLPGRNASWYFSGKGNEQSQSCEWSGQRGIQNLAKLKPWRVIAATALVTTIPYHHQSSSLISLISSSISSWNSYICAYICDFFFITQRKHWRKSNEEPSIGQVIVWNAWAFLYESFLNAVTFDLVQNCNPPETAGILSCWSLFWEFCKTAISIP